MQKVSRAEEVGESVKSNDDLMSHDEYLAGLVKIRETKTMDGINDLEYKELRLDLVDLTEGVVGSFLFYYDEEVKKIYELPPQKRGAELRKLANRIKEDYKTGRIAV